MRQKSVLSESVSEQIVKGIRRASSRRHSSEEKIRIILDGLRNVSARAACGECANLGRSDAARSVAGSRALWASTTLRSTGRLRLHGAQFLTGITNWPMSLACRPGVTGPTIASFR